MRSADLDASLVFNTPALLADSLAQGHLDAALLPSIEYLRGVGERFITGPALIAQQAAGTLFLVTQKPFEQIERVAVDEHNRTPVAVLRIVLAEHFGVMPDFLVEKNLPMGWRDSYDAVLINGDAALSHRFGVQNSEDKAYDVVSAWYELTGLPLVSALWVFNDRAHEGSIAKRVVRSRNFGVQNVERLAEGIALTSEYGSEDLLNYFTKCWSYEFGDRELSGLRALQDYALRYDLVRARRLTPVVV